MGWRGAFLCAAALGVVAAIVVFLTQRAAGDGRSPSPRRRTSRPTHARDGWKLLLSAPILANLVFFILLSMSGGGLYNYLVATLGALHGTPATVANTALTGLLAMSAVGVLVGGQLTGFTSRYGLVTTVGLLCTATVCVLVGMIDFPALVLIVLMSSVGFFNGLTMPSRDMIVRAVTPRERLWPGVRLRDHRLPSRRHRLADHLRADARPRLSARDLLLHGVLRAALDRHGDLLDHAQAGELSAPSRPAAAHDPTARRNEPALRSADQRPSLPVFRGESGGSGARPPAAGSPRAG